MAKTGIIDLHVIFIGIILPFFQENAFLCKTKESAPHFRLINRDITNTKIYIL